MKLTNVTILVATLAVVLALFAPSAAAKTRKDIKLTFEVDDGELKLKTGWLSGTTQSNCSRSNHPGCYEILNNYYGKFELTLKKGDADCGDAEDWKWHAVTLGGESSLGDVAPKPEIWGNISAEAAKDFDADPATGVVNTVADGKKRVSFESQNDHPHSIWYKVSVEQCGSGEVLEYDPRIDNRG